MKILKDYECSLSKLYPAFRFRCPNGTLANDFNCTDLHSCHNEVLTLDIPSKTGTNNLSEIFLRWKEPYVTHMEDFYSYDAQSFIGEVGGTLGLFLGFSFTMISGNLEKLFENLINWMMSKCCFKKNESE